MSADPELAAQADAWEDLGRVDPLWAVLTDPSRRGRRWSESEFLATGRDEVTQILDAAAQLGRPASRRTALDFGCGVGRLTLPLAEQFTSAVGVDISGAMVARARQIGVDRLNVRFEVLAPSGAVPFPDRSFDFVLSLYVLQHQPSRAVVVRQLAELARLVGPGGLLVVQLPAPIPRRHRIQPRRRAYEVLRRLGLDERFLFDRLALSPMRLIGLPQADVRDVLTKGGLEVVDVRADHLSRSSMASFTYYAGRRASTMADDDD